MRSGKHFALFTQAGFTIVGVVRPVQIDRATFGDGELDSFSPGFQSFWEYLIGQRTDSWGDSNVHCCTMNTAGSFCNLFSYGTFHWYDWISRSPIETIDGIQGGVPIGLLLDLVERTLTAYQNGQRIGMLKDGLSGEYCWCATASSGTATSVSVERSLAPDD
jgi:hypothetical protein